MSEKAPSPNALDPKSAKPSEERADPLVGDRLSGPGGFLRLRRCALISDAEVDRVVTVSPHSSFLELLLFTKGVSSSPPLVATRPIVVLRRFGGSRRALAVTENRKPDRSLETFIDDLVSEEQYRDPQSLRCRILVKPMTQTR